MRTPHLSDVVRHRLRSAAGALGTADPTPVVGQLIDRSFELAPGDERYGTNTLTPGTAPFEPSFSEREPRVLRFTIEPMGPQSSAGARRDEATREMRRLVGPTFGREALRWFDQRSEEWRSFGGSMGLDYGAWFGSAFDNGGLQAAKVYYELQRSQLGALSPALTRLVATVTEAIPSLYPVFTSIACGRDRGHQRVTFVSRGPLRLVSLDPLVQRLGLSGQLPGLMQVIGVALGGRFELPARSVLLGVGETPEGPEIKLEVMLGMIPDLPASFLDLLALGLAERPRQLRAMSDWLKAFTPEGASEPGQFSVLSVRITPRSSARVSLYLRPVEFEISGAGVVSPTPMYV